MILAFPYLRVVVMMWLSEPGETTPTVAIPGAFTSAALMLGVLATFVLGVSPEPLLDLADRGRRVHPVTQLRVGRASRGVPPWPAAWGIVARGGRRESSDGCGIVRAVVQSGRAAGASVGITFADPALEESSRACLERSRRRCATPSTAPTRC